MIAPTTDRPRVHRSLTDEPTPSSTPPWTRPVVIAVLLLVLYLVCSVFTDGGGYLSTDTGGKVATLDAMAERGDLRPDLGYWAESVDPDGSLYPMYGTLDIDGQWVNATSLPMIYLALPLYRWGGYELASPGPDARWCGLGVGRRPHRSPTPCWPAEGRGRASERTVDGGDRVGDTRGDLRTRPLGTHARPGPDAVGHVVRSRSDSSLERRARHRRRTCFGAAATMRQEALVYGAVAGVIVVGLGLRRRSVSALVPALGMAASTVAMLAAGVALEVVAMGSSLRTGRTTGTASSSGGKATLRLHEAVVTLGSIDRLPLVPAFLLVGVLITGFALLTAEGGRAPLGAGDDRATARNTGAWAVRGGLLVALVYLLLIAGFAVGGLSFVSGLLLASPIAGLGLVLGLRRTGLQLAWAMAVVPLPMIWLTQYTGGAGPQWGGRYLLASGALLATIGLVELDRVPRHAGRGLLVLSAVITLLGVAWLGQRSSGFANATADLAERPEPVLIFDDPHAARESGPVARNEQWFAATGDESRREAGAAVSALGYESFGFVSYQASVLDGDAQAERSYDERVATLTASFEGFHVVGSDRIPLLPGVELEVITFARP
ncbi:MAG: hypothetical protein R2710_23700 [Acidimicrobiales bacterium]